MAPHSKDAINGRSLIQGGALQTILSDLHLSPSRAASLIGVSPTSLSRWIAGTREISTKSAIRLFTWYKAALPDLQKAYSNRTELDRLIPIGEVASRRGVSIEVIRQKCQQGALECRDLGVFGTYILGLGPKEDM